MVRLGCSMPPMETILPSCRLQKSNKTGNLRIFCVLSEIRSLSLYNRQTSLMSQLLYNNFLALIGCQYPGLDVNLEQRRGETILHLTSLLQHTSQDTLEYGIMKMGCVLDRYLQRS